MTHLVKACCVRSRSQTRPAAQRRCAGKKWLGLLRRPLLLPSLRLPPRRLPPRRLPMTLAWDVVENDSFVCYHRTTQITTDACRSLQRNALCYTKSRGPARSASWNGYSISLPGVGNGRLNISELSALCLNRGSLRMASG